MTLTLTKVQDNAMELAYDGRLLFRYLYRPQLSPTECNRPYFHPLCDLHGLPVTAYRPHDHRWHNGLSMTCADINKNNFWGGGTFVRGKGYVPKDNHGCISHVDWGVLSCVDDGVELVEQVQWIARDGRPLIDDCRRIVVSQVNPQQNYWVLDHHFELTALESLRFGSPTTNGRDNAGYGGLFWRGPRCFQGGQVLVDEPDVSAENIMGNTSPWLAYIAKHDEVDAESTLLFIDSQANPRYPNKWFVRNTASPMVCFSFMFDQVYELTSNDTLTLDYRTVIIAEAWSRQRIEQYLSEAPLP